MAVTTSSSGILSRLPGLRRYRTQMYFIAFLFLFPALVNFILFRYIPILWAGRASLWQYTLLGGYRDFIGLDHYARAIADPILQTSLIVTFVYVMVKVPLQIMLSLALALFTSQEYRGMGIMRSIIFVPVVTSMVVVSIIFALIFNADSGLINSLLVSFGFSRVTFLRNPDLALWTIIMVTLWKDLGFSMILFVAGLKGIPGVFYEAARVDGATRWKQFRHITLPLLMPTMMFVVVTQTIFTFQVFIPIYTMTEGGPRDATKVIVYYIYQLGFLMQDMGYAAAISMILLVLILIISVLQMRFLRSDVQY